jgi:isopenicillin N synthase-like dioxygenase
MESLPVIDISAWVSSDLENLSLSNLSIEQCHCCKRWNEELSKDGYAVLLNHGIEDEQFSVLNDQALDFFKRCMADKMRYNHGPYGNPYGGYTPIGFEQVALSTEDTNGTEEPSVAKFDPVENFVFCGHPSKFTPPDENYPMPPIRTLASVYFEKVSNLLKILHYISAAALNIEQLDFFHNYYDDELSSNADKGSNGNAIRLAYYPSMTNMRNASNTSASEVEEDVRYGAHTDYLGFTILRADKTDWHIVDENHNDIQCGGLEIFSRTNQCWKQVKIPIEWNALIINTGLFLYSILYLFYVNIQSLLNLFYVIALSNRRLVSTLDEQLLAFSNSSCRKFNSYP